MVDGAGECGDRTFVANEIVLGDKRELFGCRVRPMRSLHFTSALEVFVFGRKLFGPVPTLVAET